MNPSAMVSFKAVISSEPLVFLEKKKMKLRKCNPNILDTQSKIHDKKKG